ncbi:unnamed protein product [Cladocopium goreaui]|uniref:Uncharacterized protein n=1 Tax=Cladocopium goreaui TaxID=2562237 RepID=A0A9P1GT87_9DINO|nr:unnamed protein product [Cladocopium goreaui]
MDLDSNERMQKIYAHFEGVTSEQNLGSYIYNKYSQVIQHLVIDRYRGEPKPDLNLVPRESRDEMWLPLYCFDISPDGKNVYPQNAQFSAHIKEFMTGYRIRLGHVTSDKQTPSAVDYLGHFLQAIELEKRMQKQGQSKPLKDMLNGLCATYNKMAVSKKHKIDSHKRGLIYNLLRAPANFHKLLHSHYDLFRHETSGLPLDILQNDWWVPGSTARADSAKYAGKSQWQEILNVTERITVMWGVRATQDFCRKVGKDSSNKMKKQAQLDEERHQLLFDVCCLWEYLLPKLESTFPKPTVEKCAALFSKGSLDADLGALAKAAEPFEWERISFILELRGECLEDYISQCQDVSKNAQTKSLQAAYNCWAEQLNADGVIFESEQILSEKESAKRRAKLVGQLEACHQKAWKVVSEYLGTSLRLFAGRSADAESTVLPSLAAWLQESISEVPEARSSDDHGLVIWLNLPTAGIIGASKYDFLLTSVTTLLTMMKKNSIALLVHPNRAAQMQPNRNTKKEEDGDMKDEDCLDEGSVKNDPGSDSDSNDRDGAKDEADVRDVRYNLEKDLSAKERNLVVRNVTWVFSKVRRPNPPLPEESIYGKRDGAITGIAVMHMDKANSFRRCSLWNRGVVDNVEMLSRSNMFKPQALIAGKANLPHLGRALTDVQELKQVSGGTHFVEQTLSLCKPATMATTFVIDLHCYDGWPALAVLQEAARDQRIFCASVVLDTKPDGIQQYLANAVYEACRTQSLKLAGFPDFSQYIQGLKDAKPEVQINEYKVCVKRGPRLVVLGALAQQWLQSEQFKLEATNLVEAHNKKFNPDGDFVEEPEVRTICTKKSARAQKNSCGYQKIS